MGRPDPKNAFFVWSQTVFARERLTSAVELYNAQRHPGQPLRAEPSRVHRQRAAAAGRRRRVSGTCSASRCRSDRRSGSSCTPSAASASAPGTAAARSARSSCTSPSTTTARCRSSRRRAHTSSSSGPASERRRARLRPATTCTSRSTAGVSSRSTRRACRRGRSRRRSSSASTIRRAGRSGKRSRSAKTPISVYFTNDRARIYAIGYPQLTLFDHLVHLAEVSTLAGAAFVLVLLATAIFTRVSRERPRVGRALLREIRASFYRKLFLAFVLASIIPVLDPGARDSRLLRRPAAQGHSGARRRAPRRSPSASSRSRTRSSIAAPTASSRRPTT